MFKKMFSKAALLFSEQHKESIEENDEELESMSYAAMVRNQNEEMSHRDSSILESQ